MNDYEGIRLHISEDVERLVKDRLIQREDLQKVIHRAETTGRPLEKEISRTRGTAPLDILRLQGMECRRDSHAKKTG